MWPQLILLIIFGTNVIYNIFKQFSRKRTAAEKAESIQSMFAALIVLGLLYWGDFFDCFFK